jgi:plasmid stabilization system protein ParE
VLEVEVTPRAAAQLERAARWWSANRPAAPNAIADDFEQAMGLLSQQPGLGAQSSSSRYRDLRRLFLTRVGYHIYYRLEPSKVVVLAFWRASRRNKAEPLICDSSADHDTM